MAQATPTQSGANLLPPNPVSAFSNVGVDVSGAVAVFYHLWIIYSIAAFAVSACFIYGIIYAMYRSSQLGAEEEAELRARENAFAAKKFGGTKNSRWEDVQKHVASGNPNDWRLAIIEADIILEEALEERGYAGTTIGDKLKSASPEQFKTLDDAWKAHRVRNEIAHAGSDFVLTQRTAEETIQRFTRVFTELGKI